MNEKLSEEERRRRRNEASRRCYLKKKAAMAAGTQAKPVKEAKSAQPAKPVKVQPVEKLVKKYVKIASAVKPMLTETAEFLKAVYQTGDKKTVKAAETAVQRGLGVKIEVDGAKTRVVLHASSAAVKTPAFKIVQDVKPTVQEEEAKLTQCLSEICENTAEETASEEEAPAEVPLDPAVIAKIDAGEINADDAVKSGYSNNFDDDEDDDDDDEDEDEDEDENDEDEEDEDDFCGHRRQAGDEDDWRAGRADMDAELREQGAYDGYED